MAKKSLVIGLVLVMIIGLFWAGFGCDYRLILNLVSSGTLSLFSLDYNNPYAGYTQSTPTPLFTVTLSPSTQTVVQELDQIVGFKVTMQGNANYPCAIVFHSNNLPDNLLFELGLSSSYTTTSPNYTVSGGFVDVEGNIGTYSLYVTVIDSNGNSYTSNYVSVTVK
jgi:hypothetical protein